MAENEGRLVRQDWFELAAPNLRIEHIQTGGMHFDEDVVFAKNWLGRFAKAQGALLAIAVENEGFHALLIFPVSPVGYEGPRRSFKRFRRRPCGPGFHQRGSAGHCPALAPPVRQ